MHRWVSRSSSVRRTPARSRSCSSGSSPSSTAIRGSIVPNRADVERVERELVERCGGLLAGTVATFDGLFEHARRAATSRRPTRARGDRARDRRSGGSPSASPAGQVARSRATPTRWAGRSRSSTARSSSRRTSASRSPTLRRVSPTSSTGSRRGIAAHCAVARSSASTGELDAWAGRPVLAYGFEDLTGAEWRLLEALAARTDVTSRFPTSPGARSTPRSRRTVDDLAASRGDVVELPPRSTTFLPAGARPPRAAALRRRVAVAEPARRRRSGSSKAPARAGRSSSSPTRCSASSAAASPPEEIAVVCPSVERRQARARGGVRAPRRPGRVRGPRRAADDAVRARAARSAALRLAGRRAARAVRAPPLAVLRRRATRRRLVEGRLRGRGVLRGDARSRSRSSSATVVRSRPLDLRAGRGARARRRAAAGGRDAAATPTGRLRRRSTTASRPTCGRTTPSRARSTSSSARVGRASSSARRRRSRRSSARPSAASAPASPAASRCSTSCAPGRGASTRSSCSGSSRARCRGGRGVSRSSTTTRGERSTTAAGRASSRPDAASRDRYLFATACTRPRRRLVARPRGGGDEGSPREPSPFWEASRELFDADDVRRHTTRRPLSALTWPIEAAPTERERLRALARARGRRNRARPHALARANGWERRLERATTRVRPPHAR